MSGLEILLIHEKRIPYSFVGFILGVFGIVIGIYLSVFYEKAPQLDIEIISQFNALDIKESVERLDVIYDGKSLNAEGRSLSVIELKIINNGNASILRDYYDPESKAGFKVNYGSIPETPLVIDSDTSYHQREIMVERKNDNTILIPNIIINPNQYYTIKFIVLHDSSKKPTVQPLGVIAGFASINVLTKVEGGDNKNLIQSFFYGTLAMNIVRFIVLGAAFIFFTVFIGIIFSEISDFIFKIKKKRLINQFKMCNTQRLNDIPSSFFIFLENSEADLLSRMLKDIKENASYLHAVYHDEFKSLGVIHVSEIGRRIIDTKAMSILTDFLYFLAEEKVIEKPVAEDKNHDGNREDGGGDND